MTRQRKPVNTLDAVAQGIDAALDRRAQAVAKRLGPPSGTEGYTQREVEDLWDTPDNAVDQQALFAALQQGITPEGAQKIALFRMAPDLAQFAVGTPLPPDQAAAVAKMAEYPGRYVLTSGHSSDPEEQVEFVADMHRKAAKRQMQQAAPVAVAAPEEGAYP